MYARGLLRGDSAVKRLEAAGRRGEARLRLEAAGRDVRIETRARKRDSVGRQRKRRVRASATPWAGSGRDARVETRARKRDSVGRQRKRRVRAREEAGREEER